ncbi:MAG: GMC family oxidoreductase [Verrucomicrobia subdivision 3 bacterium]|nr:GMC family oxidoreductase [Limisphaerales bacterium]
MDFDAIVIGSGFGGAITACRLAEAGCKTLILERGRRWETNNYPRRPADAWVWDQDCPEKCNGWLDFRAFQNIAIAAGAGVGGGSLIYANVSCEAPAHVFDSGWPPEITYAALKPYYDRVAKFMCVQKVPLAQWNPRMNLMREAATALGHSDRFKQLELAVSFDPEMKLDIDRPPTVAESRTFINQHGIEQGYCVHLGECDIGCSVGAKNTLDKNYIPVAERHGAEVRPLHVVNNIEPIAGGYRVHSSRVDAGRRVATNQTARRVIVAAGSLGSTELLLRCKMETKSLPRISAFLGRNWCSNGDFLTPAVHLGRTVHPSIGPTISTAIDFQDGSQGSERFWIEDGGMPHLLYSGMQGCDNKLVHGEFAQIILGHLQNALRSSHPLQHVMPWFAQAADVTDGVFTLRRRWWLIGPRRLHLSWRILKSKKAFDTVVEMHCRLAEVTGGVPVVPAYYKFCQSVVTPHPLGGCNMGTSRADGVVNHAGQVFGYENLYVADAAIIPEALGVNPSRTIGALAERIAEIMIAKS